MMPSLSPFDFINIVNERWLCPDPKIYSCIPTSAADAVAVNPRGKKKLLANGLITFFINGNPFLVMEPEVYQEILPSVSS